MILKRTADAVYVYRFIRTLVLRWESTQAFRLGLIDRRGKNIREPETKQEKDAYTFFHRVTFNIKRLLERLPGIAGRLASFASALYLLKEHTGLTEDEITEALKQVIDIDESPIQESFQHEIHENRVYQINKDIPIYVRGKDIEAIKGSTVTIRESLGEWFGTEVYSATHNLSGKEIFVTGYDIAEDMQLEEFSADVSYIPDVPKPLKTDHGDKYQKFKVPSEIFRRFECGRKKYQRWKTQLDLTDTQQCCIRDFARKHPDALIVIEDETTGALRAIRRTSADGC